MYEKVQISKSKPKKFSFLCTFHVITEANPKGKHCVWDPTPELTISSPFVHSNVDSNTSTMGNPKPEWTFTLCQSQRDGEYKKRSQSGILSLISLSAPRR